MVATCFLLGIVRTFQGFIYDIYFSNSLYFVREGGRNGEGEHISSGVAIPNRPQKRPGKCPQSPYVVRYTSF